MKGNCPSIHQPGNGPSADVGSTGAMILDFPASGTRKNKWLLRSHRGYGIFVTAAQTDEDRASLRPLSNLVFHCSHLPEPKTSTDVPGLSIQGHTLVHGTGRKEPDKISFLLPLLHYSEGLVWAFSSSHVSHPRESCLTRSFMDSHPLPCAQRQTQSQCRQTHALIQGCHPRSDSLVHGGQWVGLCCLSSRPQGISRTWPSQWVTTASGQPQGGKEIKKKYR